MEFYKATLFATAQMERIQGSVAEQIRVGATPVIHRWCPWRDQDCMKGDSLTRDTKSLDKLHAGATKKFER